MLLSWWDILRLGGSMGLGYVGVFIKRHWGWVLVVLIVAGWLTHRAQLAEADSKYQALAARFKTQQPLDSTSQAVVTGLKLEVHDLSDLVRAEHETNGKLVAALKLKVPGTRHDTVHEALPTVTTPDSSRTATFQDSTADYAVRGTVIAPRCCAPLAIAYQVTTPPFAPEIGVIRIGTKYLAVVAWQHHRYEIADPFFDARTALPRWSLTAAPSWDVGDRTVTAEMRAGFRVLGEWELTAGLRQEFLRRESPHLSVGVAKTWRWR